MTSDTDLVQLTTSRTAIEAEWIVGALKGMGIVAVTFGDQLADEFAMSQQLMGLSGGVRVMVQRGQLEAAREALETIEQDRPSEQELEEALTQADVATGTDEPMDRGAESSSGGTATPVIVILGLVVGVLAWLSVSQHRKLSAYEQDSLVSRTRWRGDGWETRWQHNGELAAVSLDRDANGVSEESWSYSRDGRLTLKLYDKNQNEIWELVISTDPDGNELMRSVDADENGLPELVEYPAANGVQERWIDADEDCRYERYEFVDPDTGTILDAFEDRGRDGYVRTR